MKDKLLVISDLHRPGAVIAWGGAQVEFNEKGEALVPAELAVNFAAMPRYHVPELERGEAPMAQPEPEPVEEQPAPKNWGRATKAELIDELVTRGVVSSAEEAEDKTKAELLILLG